jgi:PAT family beta-lactamase induction signal transducer AmpG
MAVLFLFGFSSGLPLLLTGQTLTAWMTSAGVELANIAAFSLVGLAYTFKFAWAPLLDRYRLPFLGRRRGWVLATQLALVGAIATMGVMDPVSQPGSLAVVAVIVAVLSASQDIVLDAYNADLLTAEQRAAGAAIYVFGYRVAMLVTGTLALFMADYLPWRLIYGVIALLMGIGIVGTILAEEPAAPARKPTTLVAAVYLPFVELFRRLGTRGAVLVLAFVAVYKFGDSFAQVLVITFFKRGLGFEWVEIATIYKGLGFAGMAIGGMCAGALVARFGIRKMLIAFGILQACTNLLYGLLAVTGKSYVILGAAVLCDNITGAMGTSVFVAFLMSVCSPTVSATQFALLTSLSSVGQRVFGPFADDVVTRVDWSGFFAVTTLMAVPGLILAYVVSRKDGAAVPAPRADDPGNKPGEPGVGRPDAAADHP